MSAINESSSIFSIMPPPDRIIGTVFSSELDLQIRSDCSEASSAFFVMDPNDPVWISPNDRNSTESADNVPTLFWNNQRLIVCIPTRYVLISIFPAILSLVTVLGNTLIIAAIFSNQKLGQKLTSILILNLSISDLLVGSTVMPFGVMQIMTNGIWLFGRTMCRIWASLDIILCTASIVSLCVISIDRFIGVMRPLRYQQLVNRTRLIVSAVGIWIFSVGVLLTTIQYHPSKTIPSTTCHVGNEQKYITYGILLSFFIPLVIIMVMYYKIYLVTKRREKSLLFSLFYGSQKFKTPRKPQPEGGRNRKNGGSDQQLFTDILFPGLRIHYGGQENSIEQRRNFYKKHKKSAKTLGLVVGAFLICWLPFFALYLIQHLCNGCVDALILDLFTWLGYSNSAINPVIYAATWKTFRETFYGFIRHRCRLFSSSCCGRTSTPAASSVVGPPRLGNGRNLPINNIQQQQYQQRAQYHPSAQHQSRKMQKLKDQAVHQKNASGSATNSNQTSVKASNSWMNLKLYKLLINDRSTIV